MNRIFQPFLKTLTGFSLAMALFAVSGCGVVEQQIANYRINRQYNSELQELVQGHDAFQKGDFKEAQELFDNLRYGATNDEIVRNAMFGLACTHFVLAENPEEFKVAMALWESWKQLVPASMGGEDPRMLDQLLRRKFSHLMAETKPGGTSELSKIIQFDDQLKAKEKEIHNLKHKLKEREAEIIALKEQNMHLKGKEAELEKLKNQINKLEAIEQKIQRKKKEMTSP